MPEPVKHIEAVPNTPFQRRMARGHYLRHGHDMDATHVSADGQLWHSIKRCCGEAIPATVGTMDEALAP